MHALLLLSLLTLLLQCNIFDDDEPNCPWCSASPYVSWVPGYGSVGVMVATAVGIFTLFVVLIRNKWKKNPTQNMAWWKWMASLMVSVAVGMLLSFVLFTSLMALIFWLFSDYPYFLWIDNT